MAKRKASSPVPFFLFLLFLAAVGGVIYFYQENLKLTHFNQALLQKSGKKTLVLFFVKSTPTAFYLKPVFSELKNDQVDEHLQALEDLFAGPPAGLSLQGIFPKGTHCLGITVQNGVATVNLNQQATKLNVGSEGEALAIASIVNTLTKFPDIFRVKLLIEGKEIESLAGHVDTTGIFAYNDQVVDLD